jgi:WD40 repeat protein
LGGLEGIKRRLASGVEPEQIAALKQALKSGEAGLDLVIQALNDESRQVEKAAYQLLRKSVRPKAKQVLQKHSPWRIFECIRTIQGHSDWVWSVAVSPDSQTIVSGSMDRTIKIWHLKTGKEIRTLQGHLDTVESVVFSTDGQTIVSGSCDKTNLELGDRARTPYNTRAINH